MPTHSRHRLSKLLWRRYTSADRNIARQLTIAQFKLKDQSSFFGLLWTFLHPIALLLVFYSFFSGGFEGRIEHYGVYLLLGLVLYTHFSNCTSQAMRVLRSTRALTTDTIFHKELLVFSTLIAGSVELLISIAFCVLLAAVTGLPVTAALIALPAILLAQILFATWVGLLLAAIHPFVWDVDHLYSVFLRMLLFITPIFYDVSFVGDGIGATVIALNPLAWITEALRTIVIGGVVPDLSSLLVFLAVNLFLIVASLVLFRSLEAKYAEYV